MVVGGLGGPIGGEGASADGERELASALQLAKFRCHKVQAWSVGAIWAGSTGLVGPRLDKRPCH